MVVEPEPLTVEDSWLLHAYTFFHGRSYRTLRVSLPGERDPEPAVAHLLLPPGPGPHPAVIVFPILAGTHVVSEALAKGLVRRGYAVLRMERRALPFEEAQHPDELAEELAAGLRDGRRALDWLTTQPEIDAGRIGAAGVSLGSILACLLQATDARVSAGFFALAGGGLPELLYDSAEPPVRAFRDRMLASYALADRDAFLDWIRPSIGWLDPLRYAGAIESPSVFMVNGRFDRVVPEARARALWEALGRPLRLVIPTGHYQALLFLWHVTARGADHFDRALAVVPGTRGAADRQARRSAPASDRGHGLNRGADRSSHPKGEGDSPRFHLSSGREPPNEEAR